MEVEVIKTPESDVIPEETQPELPLEEAVEEKPKEDKTVEILREIDKKLTPKEETGPSAQQIYARKREALKERFGWDDSQVDAYEADKAESMAPIKEELAWTKLKSEASHLTPEIEAEMKEELKQYPAHLRGDKVLLDKIYYMALGKKSSLNKHTSAGETTVSKEDSVVSRRVVSNGGPAVSMGSSSPSKAAKVSEDEKVFARKMRMTDEEYAQYRDDTVVEHFRKK